MVARPGPSREAVVALLTVARRWVDLPSVRAGSRAVEHVPGRNAEARRAYGRPRARTPTMRVANATMRATPDTARVATNSRIDCSRTLRIAWLSGSTEVKASIAPIVSFSWPDPSRERS